MKNSKLSKIKFVVISLWISLGVVILLLITFGFYLLLSKVILLGTEEKPKGENLDDQIQQYRILHIDTTTQEEVHTGIVELPKMKEGYKFYFDEEFESYTLISEFGSTQYSCTGSCYCNDDGERRFATTTTSSKTLFFLLTAVSTAIAYNIAQEYFHEECTGEVNNMMDSCTKDGITSEVKSCEKLSSEEEEGTNEEDDESSFEYHCSCRCYGSRFRDELLNMKSSLGKTHPLTKHPILGNKLECHKMIEENLIEFKKSDMDIPNPDNYAKKFFLVNNCSPFCEDVSKFYFPPNQDMIDEGIWGKKKPICIADPKTLNCKRIEGYYNPFQKYGFE